MSSVGLPGVGAVFLQFVRSPQSSEMVEGRASAAEAGKPCRGRAALAPGGAFAAGGADRRALPGFFLRRKVKDGATTL